LELGGKSPNIFFADVMDKEDSFFDKALEGFALFAFNQGEVCTCPSRALVQESIYERFMERAIKRVEAIKTGNPLDAETQMGAQVSAGQMKTILDYIEIGKKEGAHSTKVTTCNPPSCWAKIICGYSRRRSSDRYWR
jgi:aldehyde dehydrogenase